MHITRVAYIRYALLLLHTFVYMHLCYSHQYNATQLLRPPLPIKQLRHGIIGKHGSLPCSIALLQLSRAHMYPLQGFFPRTRSLHGHCLVLQQRTCTRIRGWWLVGALIRRPVWGHRRSTSMLTFSEGCFTWVTCLLTYYAWFLDCLLPDLAGSLACKNFTRI